MKTSVINSVPTTIIAGLTTVLISTNSVGSGEYYNGKHVVGKHLVSQKPSGRDDFFERYKVDLISNSINKEIMSFLDKNIGLSDLLEQTINDLRDVYNVFSHKIELYEDDEEDYTQIAVLVYSADEDKVNKYFDFTDKWAEKIPSDLSDKIVLTVVTGQRNI